MTTIDREAKRPDDRHYCSFGDGRLVTVIVRAPAHKDRHIRNEIGVCSDHTHSIKDTLTGKTFAPYVFLTIPGIIPSNG